MKDKIKASRKRTFVPKDKKVIKKRFGLSLFINRYLHVIHLLYIVPNT